MNTDTYHYREHVIDVQEGNTLFSVFLLYTKEEHYVMITINNDDSVYFLYTIENLHTIEPLYKLVHDNVDIEDVETRMLIDYHMEIYGADY